MKTKHTKLDSQGVQKRAARIRSHWSPLERVQRTGLPPDIPARLRDYILGSAQPQFSIVAAGAQKVCSPFRP